MPRILAAVRQPSVKTGMLEDGSKLPTIDTFFKAKEAPPEPPKRGRPRGSRKAKRGRPVAAPPEAATAVQNVGASGSGMRHVAPSDAHLATPQNVGTVVLLEQEEPPPPQKKQRAESVPPPQATSAATASRTVGKNKTDWSAPENK